MQIWRMKPDGSEQTQITADQYNNWFAHPSPDGKWLASSGDDNLVSVRDAASGELRAALRGHLSELLSLAFTPDGRTLASSAADGTVRLWHLPTWRELGVLHDGENLRDLEFVEQGSTLMATDGEGRARRFPAVR
jgi:WD40 repeat protein